MPFKKLDEAACHDGVAISLFRMDKKSLARDVLTIPDRLLSTVNLQNL